MRRRRITAERPKLSVYTDRATMRQIRRDAIDSDLTIEALVNERLRLSYASHPAPLVRQADPSVA